MRKNLINMVDQVKTISDSIIKASDILRELFGDKDDEINEIIKNNELFRREVLKEFKKDITSKKTE